MLEDEDGDQGDGQPAKKVKLYKLATLPAERDKNYVEELEEHLISEEHRLDFKRKISALQSVLKSKKR